MLSIKSWISFGGGAVRAETSSATEKLSIMPSVPMMAPGRLARLEKIPKMMAGKKLAAAKPNANATTYATKPGGLIPKYSATHTATPAEFLMARSSPFSRSSALFDYSPQTTACATTFTDPPVWTV